MPAPPESGTISAALHGSYSTVNGPIVAKGMASDATSEANNVAEASKELRNMTVGPNIALSAEQKAVLDKVKAGRNVFFTGSAGAYVVFTL